MSVAAKRADVFMANQHTCGFAKSDCSQIELCHRSTGGETRSLHKNLIVFVTHTHTQIKPSLAANLQGAVFFLFSEARYIWI